MHDTRTERLIDEHGAFVNIFGNRYHSARSDQYTDVWPALCTLSRQIETCQFSRRHMHISEKELDAFGVLLEQLYRFGNLGSFVNQKAGCFQDVRRIHSDESIVISNESIRC